MSCCVKVEISINMVLKTLCPCGEQHLNASQLHLKLKIQTNTWYQNSMEKMN
jgi:hypothetical protein